MPLVLDNLKTALGQQWLVPDGGSYPGSVAESGDHFATAVANWFALGMAGAFPCTTAMARQSQLSSAAAAALSAMAAPAAGAQLALAVATYMAGQAFGAGVAAMPIATSAAVAMMTATFSDLNGSVSDKAQQIA